MIQFSRRSLLLAGGTALAAQKFAKPLSLQLYTLRNVLPAKPRETIEAVAKIGFTQVETVRADMAKVMPHLKEFRLAVPSGHFDSALFTGNWEFSKQARAAMPPGYDLAAAIADAKAAGMRYMVVPYVQKAEREAADFYPRFADQLNKAGEQVHKAGMTLCYHHHSFELEAKNGKKPLDLLVERFDPKLVHWELDLFWLQIGGDDPLARLKQLKGRVAAVHLKDIAAGTKNEYWEGNVPKTAFKEVGNGTMDWAKTLKACADAGVGLYIVEQDQCPGNPLDSIGQSYRYLRGVSL